MSSSDSLAQRVMVLLRSREWEEEDDDEDDSSEDETQDEGAPGTGAEAEGDDDDDDDDDDEEENAEDEDDDDEEEEETDGGVMEEDFEEDDEDEDEGGDEAEVAGSLGLHREVVEQRFLAWRAHRSGTQRSSSSDMSISASDSSLSQHADNDNVQSGTMRSNQRNSFSSIGRNIVEPKRTEKATNDYLLEKKERERVQRRRNRGWKPKDFRENGSLHLEWSRQIDALRGKVAKDKDKMVDNEKLATAALKWKPSLDPEFVAVSSDGLGATYIGQSHETSRRDIFHGHVISSDPISLEMEKGYFEVDVLKSDGEEQTSADRNCDISVGIVLNEYEEQSDVGRTSLATVSHSVAYSGRSGSLWVLGKEESAFRVPCFGDGDTIGCLMDKTKCKVVFFKNGNKAGAVNLPRSFQGDLRFYCGASLHTKGDSIRARFQEPFKFSEAVFPKETKQVTVEIDNKQDFELQPDCIPQLVREYLFFHAHKETLDAFKAEAPNLCSNEKQHDKVQPRRTVESIFSPEYLDCMEWTSHHEAEEEQQPDNEKDCLGIQQRDTLRNFVLDGEPLKAMKYIEDSSSKDLATYLQTDCNIFELLRDQHFVELVRMGETSKAIEFAKKELPFESSRSLLRILAYKDPENSPAADLMSLQRRAKVADALNRAILTFGNRTPKGQHQQQQQQQPRTALETILTHRAMLLLASQCPT